MTKDDTKNERISSKFMNIKMVFLRSCSLRREKTLCSFFSSVWINMALKYGSVEHEIFPQAFTDANKKIVSISVYV